MSSVYLQRQFSFLAGAGQLDSLADLAQPLLHLRDVLPKYTLKLDAKCITTGYFRRPQASTNGMDLPTGYTSASRLCGIFTVDGKAKITLVSPTFGTSNTLLYGTKGTTKGLHRGLHSFCCDVTSVSVVIPSTANGGADTLIEYAMWLLPDLTAASSWRDGILALGVDS